MIEPKVSINLIDKNNKAYHLVGLAGKIKKRTNSSFIKRVKLGRFKRLHLRVYYGIDKKERITNDMDCKDWADLKWGLTAFLDKGLYLYDAD